MYGTIKSPNFPESYPKEIDLQWNITVPDGYQIRLYFMHFDIEPSYLCEYDYLKVSQYLQMIQSPFQQTHLYYLFKKRYKRTLILPDLQKQVLSRIDLNQVTPY